MNERRHIPLYLKPVLVLLGVFIFQAALFADAKLPVMAVMEFENAGFETDEVLIIGDYIASALVATKKYDVIDRKRRNKLLEEIEFSYSEATSEEAQIEIGKLLAADLILVGSIGQVGGQFILNLSIIDVRSSKNISSASELFPSLKALLNTSKEMVFSMTDTPYVSNGAVSFAKEDTDNEGGFKPNGWLFAAAGLSAAATGVFGGLAYWENRYRLSAEWFYHGANDSAGAVIEYNKYEEYRNRENLYYFCTIGSGILTVGFFTWAIIDGLPEDKMGAGSEPVQLSFEGGNFIGLSFNY